MKKFSEFKNTGVRYVFTDIDDTLTKDGLLTADAFQAIWTLSESGISVVPVTGRPAGWCELIARQWPVAAVVGENGGFYFRYHEKKMVRHYLADAGTRADNQKRLEKIKAEVLTSVHGAALASDQFCRIMDLAIDYCEDVTPLPPLAVDLIVSIFNKHGAQAKVSSIHVNGWFGDYNKLTTTQILCEREFGFKVSEQQPQVAFIGDSPNDEPMFDFFENSFGVANVEPFLPQLKHPPQYVGTQPHGAGFAEFAQLLLQKKKKSN